MNMRADDIQTLAQTSESAEAFKYRIDRMIALERQRAADARKRTADAATLQQQASTQARIPTTIPTDFGRTNERNERRLLPPQAQHALANLALVGAGIGIGIRNRFASVFGPRDQHANINQGPEPTIPIQVETRDRRPKVTMKQAVQIAAASIAATIDVASEARRGVAAPPDPSSEPSQPLPARVAAAKENLANWQSAYGHLIDDDAFHPTRDSEKWAIRRATHTLNGARITYHDDYPVLFELASDLEKRVVNNRNYVPHHAGTVAPETFPAMPVNTLTDNAASSTSHSHIA